MNRLETIHSINNLLTTCDDDTLAAINNVLVNMNGETKNRKLFNLAAEHFSRLFGA